MKNALKYLWDALRFRILRKGFEFNTYDRSIKWPLNGVDARFVPDDKPFTTLEIRELINGFLKNHPDIINNYIGDFMPL